MARQRRIGILDMGFGLGAALGSYLTGVLFDRYQTYQPSFYMVIGLILVSILAMGLAAPRLAQAQSGAFASSSAES
jgi:cyanate permease